MSSFYINTSDYSSSLKMDKDVYSVSISNSGSSSNNDLWEVRRSTGHQQYTIQHSVFKKYVSIDNTGTVKGVDAAFVLNLPDGVSNSSRISNFHLPGGARTLGINGSTVVALYGTEGQRWVFEPAA